jgi:hypothetical protein
MMKTAFRSSDQAYRLALGVGGSTADMLRIEIVAAIYLDRLDMLDESCRPQGPFDRQILGDLRAEAGEFADDFERGYWDGLRGRCGEIIERLNTHTNARLPEPTDIAASECDGD